jgi:hypothetical protein
MWVPVHCGIPGSEKANELARQGAAMTLLGPEPALGIPRCSTRVAIKNWTEIQHYTNWENVTGYRDGKLFIGRPCKKRADDLLKLSRLSAENGSCSPHGPCSCEEAPEHHGPV